MSVDGRATVEPKPSVAEADRDVTEDDVLALLERSGRSAFTTCEVEEGLGVGIESAAARLRDLAADSLDREADVGGVTAGESPGTTVPQRQPIRRARAGDRRRRGTITGTYRQGE